MNLLRVMGLASGIPVKKSRSLHRGFTIVELLIVVVVIAILAAITIVAYNGIRARANDSRMRTAASDVEKAMHRFSLANEKPLYSGYGTTGSVADLSCPGVSAAGGFAGSVTYSCTLEDLLVAAKLLPAGYITGLPANPHYSTSSGGRLSMMLYQCGTNKYALYWTLANPSSGDTASITNTLSECSNAVSIRDTWGMRAAKVIQL